MSQTSSTAAPGHTGQDDAHHVSYVKIWAILLALLVVSVIGPMFGVRIVTLLTAFGIAIVKAGMVVRHFMHVNLERKWIAWLLVVMLALMALMVGAVSPDVLKHDGQNWENTAAKQAVERGMAEPATPHHGAGAE